LKRAYNGGQITAPAAGTIGPRVPSTGSIIKVGETALDLYRGSTYVVGYLHTSRLFSVETGDTVVVTDGKMRSTGVVVRIEAVADALPAEFQSVFSARERQQVVRIEMDSRRENDFPIHGKVKVTGLFTPTNLTSIVKTGFAFITNTALRIVGLEPEAEPRTLIARPHFADPATVGSIGTASDEAQDQPFPEASAPLEPMPLRKMPPQAKSAKGTAPSLAQAKPPRPPIRGAAAPLAAERFQPAR
jgi:hypothetical protein